MSRKKVVVEVPDFNSVAEATETKSKCEQRLEVYPKAKIYAWIASLCMVLFIILGSFLGETNNIDMASTIKSLIAYAAMIAWIIFLAMTYKSIGGMKAALGISKKTAKVCWFFIPIFPMDLMWGMAGFAFGFIAAFAFPIITLGTVKKGLINDLNAANEYLAGNIPE